MATSTGGHEDEHIAKNHVRVCRHTGVGTDCCADFSRNRRFLR